RSWRTPSCIGSPSLLSRAIALPSEELFYTDLAKLRGWPAARLAARLPLAPARGLQGRRSCKPGLCQGAFNREGRQRLAIGHNESVVIGSTLPRVRLNFLATSGLPREVTRVVQRHHAYGRSEP